MQDIDIANLSIAAAGRALRAGDYSALELTEAYLRRIESLNPTLNAYITITAERALEDARRATAEMAAGKQRGPLHGIPIAHKDLYETAGIRTTGGAKIHAHHIPTTDCTVARKLREAGTILLGKLNTHEYAYGVTTDNPHFGATRNPWDLACSPAGSSGGSGAAVAAGMACAATGSDTGGSIRMPASVCGVVGLKPTYGRVSKAGVLPLSYRFDHAGPLTRTVEDAALMLSAIAGYDPLDANSVRIPVEDYTAGLAMGVRGLRIGVVRDYFFDQLGDGIGAAMEEAIRELQRLGAIVSDIRIAGIPEGLGGLFNFMHVEAQQVHAHSVATRPQDFGDDVLALLALFTPTMEDVMSGLRGSDALTVAMNVALETVDVLLTPTTPVTAVPFGQDTVRYGTVQEHVTAAMLRCTAPFNATHLPALSVPCGFNQAGHPIGLQLAGRAFDEALLLRVGHAYEQATDWHLRTPSVL
jgi:aspartyl-tRNA(Asn)/glutamyl-tRNA(Gln) amidotransferase subunit A